VDQDLALKILLSGESAFLTGAAGAGKTYLLNQFIDKAREDGKNVAVTATTGIAATHLGGNTIHAWSSLGVRDFLSSNFFLKMPESRQKTIQSADVLIIDEISMLHSFQLDLIDSILRQVRDNLFQPFGGLQVVFAGDFFQLPPITRKNESLQTTTRKDKNLSLRAERSNLGVGATGLPHAMNGVRNDVNDQSSFAYNSAVWRELDPTILYLTAQWRQDDAEFLDILNKIRAGEIRRADAEKVAARLNAKLDDAKGEITILETHNVAVDRINDKKLAEINGDEKVFYRQKTGRKEYVERLAKSCLAPEPLVLKKGALVMALKNDQKQRFVNGSIGEVIGFDKNKLNYPIVKFRNGFTVTVEPDEWDLTDGENQLASITQIPLRLAYAITVHKSQGMTLDAARINLARVFEAGMGYVALSRVKSLNSLSITGLNSAAFAVNPEVLEKDKEFRERSKADVERFAHLKKKNKRRK
jgi:ATP-dependent exoDNAse (exonuclease V) alpha subunit